MNRGSILFAVIFTIFSGNLSAQDYMVQGVSPNIHLVHKVVAKETWYSIGRIYNLSPKEIAAFNNLTTDKPLEIAQPLKIPLNETNFSQNDTKGSADVPVFHIVQEKEWMYRISVNYNKVPIEKLEKWNGITRDQAKAGTKLIVGYLKTKGATTSVAAKNPAEPKPVAEEKKTETVVEIPVKKPVEEPRKQEPVVVTSRQVANAGDGGYFKTMYENNGKNSSGVAGIFKSTSGWNDGKYYALMNNVTVGTIVRISLPQTNKSVYAKILGEMPDMKESAGLALRMSDAAAKELGAANNKFSVDVKY